MIFNILDRTRSVKEVNSGIYKIYIGWKQKLNVKCKGE